MFDQGGKRGRRFENFFISSSLMALRNLVAACRIVCEFVGGSKIGRRWGSPIEVVFVSDPLDTRLAPKFFPRSYCDKITSKDLWIPSRSRSASKSNVLLLVKHPTLKFFLYNNSWITSGVFSKIPKIAVSAMAKKSV